VLAIPFLTIAPLLTALVAPGEVGDPCDADRLCGEELVCNAGTCVPERFRPCDSDAACDAGDICFQETFFLCEGGDTDPAPPPPCSDDADCGVGGTCLDGICSFGEQRPGGDPPEASCTEQEISFCGPRYLGGCTEAADCGEGFDCAPLVSCACEGGGGTGDDGPRDPNEGDPPECVCEEVPGAGFCELQDLPCGSDADCPGDLQCQEIADGDQPCSIDSDGNTSCLPIANELRCAPADYVGSGPVFAQEGDERNETGEPLVPPTDDAEPGRGGCSHQGAAPVNPAAGALALLALGALFRRRRG
jgi:MYXO-CTERM domain-containing protein